jgi:hypothetical protein
MAFLLVGCADVFTFNLFRGVDRPKAPTAKDYEGAQGLDKLADDLASPAVASALKADPGAAAGIENMLLNDYLKNGVSGYVGQKAAILYADLTLLTSSADQIVSSIVDISVGGMVFTSTSASPKDTVADLLKRMIPAKVRAKSKLFESTITAFLDANDMYLLLGNSIKDQPPLDGKIDRNDVPSGVNMGNVSQKAFVSFIIASITSVLGLSREDAARQLYLLVTDPKSPSLKIINPAAPDFIVRPRYLTNIFQAAGLSSMVKP